MTHGTFRGGLVAGVALAGVLVGMLALLAALGWSPTSATAAQAQYAPVNTSPPTISDTTPQVGQTLTAGDGTWTGTQPMTTQYEWLRCNPGGQNCVAIPNATAQTYTVQAADLDNTLRVRVRKSNADGTAAADSAATERVAAAPPPGSSVPVTAVSLPDRLLIDQVQFSSNPVRSRVAPFNVRVRVLDTRGRAVSGALVFLRSTPVVTTTPPEQATGADGWVQLTVTPERDFSIVYRRGYNLQFFVRARKPGENPLAGVSTRRLVQVGIAPG